MWDENEKLVRMRFHNRGDFGDMKDGYQFFHIYYVKTSRETEYSVVSRDFLEEHSVPILNEIVIE